MDSIESYKKSILMGSFLFNVNISRISPRIANSPTDYTIDEFW